MVIVDFVLGVRDQMEQSEIENRKSTTNQPSEIEDQ
jgi:hypothetical protein